MQYILQHFGTAECWVTASAYRAAYKNLLEQLAKVLC